MIDRTYGVLLALDGDRRFETVTALTRDRAADMAEKAHPGWQALAVSERWAVAGRCRRCRTILFTDEADGREPAGLACRGGC